MGKCADGWLTDRSTLRSTYVEINIYKIYTRELKRGMRTAQSNSAKRNPKLPAGSWKRPAFVNLSSASSVERERERVLDTTHVMLLHGCCMAERLWFLLSVSFNDDDWCVPSCLRVRKRTKFNEQPADKFNNNLNILHWCNNLVHYYTPPSIL